MKITIIGAGAWGTTLANLLTDNNHQVLIYDVKRTNVDKKEMMKLHPFFDVKINETITILMSIKALLFSNTLLLALPTK